MRRRVGGRPPSLLLLALACGALAQAPDLPTAAEHIRNSPVDLAYSNNPTLARSIETTPWLNRDKKRVAAAVEHTISNKIATALEGSTEEIFEQARLTRHGLYRRVDAKFAQFVQRTVEQDGYGLWRTWESQGNCPPELLIRDPWGTISWEATYGAHVGSTECSWVVQPGMFRKDGYIRLSSAPVVLSFKTLSLLTNIEHLDVYDGAHTGARNIARYTGRKVPHQITSSGAELRLVYWVDLNRTASEGWEEIETALIAGKLAAAVRRFATMARFGVVGFYDQNARRALETIAARLSSKPQNHWMRRKWFRSVRGFEQAYNAATATVGQDADLWQKRHRHEPGKEGMPWETALGPRKWPHAFVEPEQNPNYHVVESGNRLDFTPTIEGVWQHDAPSGFSVDFTTTADCRGAGLATEGKAFMPPLSITGGEKNFKTLPFPLPASSCQLMEIDGPQTTSARPYTCAPPPTPHPQPTPAANRIAPRVRLQLTRHVARTIRSIVESLMKTAAEDEMRYCVDGSCNPMTSGTSGGGGNCSTACEVFLACTTDALVNRSEWKIGRNLYNKSLVMRARDYCHKLPQAAECLNIKVPVETDCRGLRSTFEAPCEEAPVSLSNPKSAGCLNLDCYFCGQVLWSKYFTCAIDCGQVMTCPLPCVCTHAALMRMSMCICICTYRQLFHLPPAPYSRT